MARPQLAQPVQSARVTNRNSAEINRISRDFLAPLKGPAKKNNIGSSGEAGWTLDQINLAEMLQKAFIEARDSFTAKSEPGSIRRGLPINLPKDVKVDYKKRTIEHNGKFFELPPALFIRNGKNGAQIYSNPNIAELPSIYKAPPEPAEPGDVQAQPKTPTTTATATPTSKTTDKTALKTQTNKSDTIARAPEQVQTRVSTQRINEASVQATADRIAETEAGIAQTLSQARNVLGQNITSREQMEKTSVKLAKEYGVGTNIVGQTATEENNLNAQHVRGTEIFSKKTDGDTRILPAEPGQGAPGKKSR